KQDERQGEEAKTEHEVADAKEAEADRRMSRDKRRVEGKPAAEEEQSEKNEHEEEQC
ncbi:hypothetical protein H0H92_004552, partial [Tricholoma furcatifolium]